MSQAGTVDTTAPLKHPAGLWVLIFTETWERFSHYGMRALLIIYLTTPLAMGGLGLDKPRAAALFGGYLLSIYLFSLNGGQIADRFLGTKRTIVLGGLLIAAGQLLLQVKTLQGVVASLVLIAIGTCLLKPNISASVGRLYGKDDPRRDGAFTYEYMGINIGATIAPLICGFMAENPAFLNLLARCGIHSATGWSWAFGFAGFGMVVGLAQFILRLRRIEEAQSLTATVASDPSVTKAVHPPLTSQDWARMGVIGILFVFSAIFWALFMQAGSSFNIFAKDFTRESLGGLRIPASWYQSINAGFILVFAPVFAWLWARLGNRISSVTKFSSGLLLLGLGMLIMVPAARIAQGVPGQILRVSPFWLIGLYFLHTLAELSFSPVGMSLTFRLAPPRFAGLMMGVWFASIGAGFYVSGAVTGLMDRLPLARLFGVSGWIAIGAAVLLWCLRPLILRLMAD